MAGRGCNLFVVALSGKRRARVLRGPLLREELWYVCGNGERTLMHVLGIFGGHVQGGVCVYVKFARVPWWNCAHTQGKNASAGSLRRRRSEQAWQGWWIKKRRGCHRKGKGDEQGQGKLGGQTTLIPGSAGLARHNLVPVQCSP
jgi:hypothetical protein